MDDIRRHCTVSHEEEELLTSQQCPIVLLRWLDDSSVVREVAPGNLYLGVMLPYTPLHHILLSDVDCPLVMTSGNLSEEPIAQTNDEARRRLGHMADAFLMHNRDIYARYDDSVLFSAQETRHKGQGMVPTSSRIQPIRRSRGYAPFPVRLPFETKQILAVGAELKSSFCLTRDDFAFLSQHIGDMENLETLEHFEASIALLQHLFRIKPELVAFDLHPDYFATKYANQKINKQASTQHIPGIGIQHHHAHIAACMADNGWAVDDGPVIGVAWDGTGYGLDGTIWGGEFFVGDYRGFQRAAHLEYLPMPGGDTATMNPWRLALAYVYTLTGESIALSGIPQQEVRIVHQQLDRQLNTPLTSAAGRLFDAVAALTGVRQRVTYEAQAAIELEMLATRWAADAGQDSRLKIKSPAYAFDLEPGDDGMVIRLRRLLEGVRAELAAGLSPAEIGWKFHRALAELIVSVCQHIATEANPPQAGIGTVALSGGCFQNRLLLSLAVPRLEQAGFRVLLHRQVPCNDGGISLGQAVLAQFAAPDQKSKP
jgi:hydrogenase maturation protein HypF